MQIVSLSLRAWPRLLMLATVASTVSVVSACGPTEHVEDANAMLADLQAWSERHYRNTNFVPSDSSCNLIPIPQSSHQWKAAACTLALQGGGTSDIKKSKVWAGSNGSYVLFHVDDPSFDPTSNQAWDQLAKSGTG